MEAAAQLRDIARRSRLDRRKCGCICGPCGLIGFTRFGPLTLCGLICGFVGASGAGWPSRLAAWPAPLASLVAGSYFGEDAPPKESYVHPITRVIWSQKRFMCNLTQFADALSHFPSVNTGRVHFLLASDLHSGNVCSSTCTGCHRFGYLASLLLVPWILNW